MKKELLLLSLAIAPMLSYSQNWTEIAIDNALGTQLNPTDIILVNDSVGYMACFHRSNHQIPYDRNKRAILKTTNGGASWDTLSYIKGNGYLGSFFNFKQYQGKLHAIVGSEFWVDDTQLIREFFPNFYGLIENLQTPGNWDTLLHKQDIPFDVEYKTMCPINDSIVILGITRYQDTWPSGIPKHYCYIARFNKKTKSFDDLVITLPDTVEFIHEIHFTSPLVGFLAAGSHHRRQNGYLYHTTDGGLNWQNMKEAQIGLYKTVNFFDANHGIMGGDEAVYYTSNAGFDWHTSIGIPSSFILQDVAIADSSTAYAIGAYYYYVNGSPTFLAQVYKSSNQGKGWCLVYEDTLRTELDPNRRSMHISFSNANQGVAAFGYNRIIHTTNGGGLAKCATSITEQPSLGNVAIHPNPSNGTFSITLPEGIKGGAKVSLYSIGGQLLRTEYLQSTTLQLYGLQSGMYLLRLETQQGVAVQKVVVQ